MSLHTYELITYYFLYPKNSVNHLLPVILSSYRNKNIEKKMLQN
jgi:hypothetical protein